MSLPSDAARYRCMQIMAKMSNKKVFPGLLASNSLVPKNDLEIIASCYNSQEFSSDKRKIAQYFSEKTSFIEAGLLMEAEVEGKSYLYAKDYHFFPDMGVSKGKRMGDSFVKTWEELDDYLRLRYLQLISIFQPRNIFITGIDVRKGLRYDLTNDIPSLVRKGLSKGLNVGYYDIMIYDSITTATDGSPEKESLQCEIEITYGQDSSEKNKPADLPNPEVKTFLDWFCTSFQDKTGTKYHVTGGKDGDLIKRLLKTYTLTELQKATDLMFADKWIGEHRGYSIGVLSSQINGLLSKSAGRPDDWKSKIKGGAS